MSQDTFYLDYDGVLHPDTVSRYASEPYLRLRSKGHTLFEGLPMLERALEPYPSLRIVLSTHWVPEMGFKFALAQLSPPIARRVIGSTYQEGEDESPDQFRNLTRYEQIVREVLRSTPRRWLALDDDANGWPSYERARLVKLNSYKGLSDPYAVERLREGLKRTFT